MKPKSRWVTRAALAACAIAAMLIWAASASALANGDPCSPFWTEVTAPSAEIDTAVSARKGEAVQATGGASFAGTADMWAFVSIDNACEATRTVRDPIAFYTWTFGDGSPPETHAAPDATATHAYSKSGTYTITLTVTEQNCKREPARTASRNKRRRRSGLTTNRPSPDWTDGSSIGRANLDGSSVDDGFITGTRGSYSVVADGTHIYWSNGTGHAIGRANLDGSSPDQSFIDLSGAASGPTGVAVDGQRIYWTTAGAVGRADLNGKNVDLHFVATGDSNANGVAIDGQHLYWANLAAGTIGRANLDGSSPDPGFISGANAPFGVAVDSLPEASATTVACAPAAVLLPAATICTATVTDTAGLNPPTGTVDFTASGAGAFGPPASCSLITISATQSTCQQTFAATAGGIDNITAAYRGDTFNTPSSGTARITVLAARRSGKPANSFALSRPKLNQRNGTATLIVTLPGPGVLLLSGKGVKTLTKSVRHPGKVQLTLTPQPKTSRRLGRTGRAKVTAQVTYTPTGGDPNTKSKTLTLRSGRR